VAQVVILVWHASPLPPVPGDASGDAENSLGLLLVHASSAQWGWHFPQDMGRKVVWAEECELMSIDPDPPFGPQRSVSNPRYPLCADVER
jgi:hypothetical protein